MSHMIAEIALPISIALNESFDYSVPEALSQNIKAGCRVLVPFRSYHIVGYVVKLKKHSAFLDRLKPISECLDEQPVLNNELFALAHKIQKDYFCSLADAIQTVMPIGLKKSKKAVISITEIPPQNIPFFNLTSAEKDLLQKKELEAPIVLIQDLSQTQKRWNVYATMIKKTLNEKKSVIVLVPDHEKIKTVTASLQLGLQPVILSSSLGIRESLAAWSQIKNADFTFVMGTRSAVFAPVRNLGLIIIEEEDHFAYRQEQVPHYRASDIAVTRIKSANARVILGSVLLSLDTYYGYKQQQASFLEFGSKEIQPTTRIIDMRHEFRGKGREKIISKLLEYHIANTLEHKEKLLLFVQQKGFSTFLYCPKCKKLQTCPRCTSSLKFNQKDNTLSCSTCSFKEPSFDICPQCHSTYIRYFGYGLEKVESEISRLFPTAKTISYEKKTVDENYDIMLATQGFLEEARPNRFSFDSVCVIACDQMFGRVDFRSTEKAFAKLLKLRALAKKTLCLQAYAVENDALKFLNRNDARGFLEHELKIRKELKLPPALKIGTLMIRSKTETQSKSFAWDFYNKIKKTLKGCEVYEPAAGVPFKLRNNYRHQILIKYKTLTGLRTAISAVIEARSRGVIATFDPSPL